MSFSTRITSGGSLNRKDAELARKATFWSRALTLPDNGNKNVDYWKVLSKVGISISSASSKKYRSVKQESRQNALCVPTE
jgi:hypothetical protein